MMFFSTAVQEAHIPESKQGTPSNQPKGLGDGDA